jgi:hypothetical protein
VVVESYDLLEKFRRDTLCARMDATTLLQSLE